MGRDGEARGNEMRNMVTIPFVAASAITLSPAVMAQETSTAPVARSMQYDEIIVTAQRREQNVQDVGVAISAFSQEELGARGIATASDLAKVAPSLKIQAATPLNTNFNIRGVSQNDFGDQFEPPIAIYVDEAYLSTLSSASAPIFDVARVEVLRGPQGTLFGRNATGGLIHVISAPPTDSFEGYAKATVGNYGRIDGEVAFSGPLTPGLDVRVSGYTANARGYATNLNGPDGGNEKVRALRAQLLARPTDTLTAHLILRYSNTRTRGAPYSNSPALPNDQGLGDVALGDPAVIESLGLPDLELFPKPGDPSVRAYTFPGHAQRKTWQATLKLDWEVSPSVTISSVTDYNKLTKVYSEDSDGSIVDLSFYGQGQRLHQFSQELRLSGDSGSLRYTAGGFFLDISNDSTVDLDLRLFDLFTDTQIDLKTKSYALFGQLEYDIAPQLTVIAGLRYSRDTKTADYLLEDNAGDLVAFNRATSPLARQKFKLWSAKAEIDWKPVDDVLVYASYSLGAKGGSFSAPAIYPVAGVPDLLPFEDLPNKSEKLHAFEIGAKTRFGPVTLNAGAFYYDYHDYQAFIFRGLLQTIVNRPATIKGFEVELSARPTDRLDISLNGSVLDGKVKDVTLPNGDAVDREVPMAPKFSGALTATYTVPLRDGDLSFQFSGNYQSRIYFDVLNSPAVREPAYGTGDVRVGYKGGDGAWEIAGWVRNIWDQQYSVMRLDVSALGFAQSVLARPRTYGLTFQYNFGVR